MDDKCEYCGSPLGHCAAGEYCTNELCSYIDGHYSGPRKPKPKPAAHDTALLEAAEYFQKRYFEHLAIRGWTDMDAAPHSEAVRAARESADREGTK